MPGGVFEAKCPKPDRITDPSAALAERQRARLAVAGFATDAEELAHFLSVLGLWPTDDEDAVRNLPLVDRRDRTVKRGKR